MFLCGMLFFGCTSSHHNLKELSGELNQVDGSGIKQHPWESYADTVLISKAAFVDGKPDGLWTYWYWNGQMKEEGRFNAGVKEAFGWNGIRMEVLCGQVDGKMVQVLFSGQDHPDHILARDSLYALKIRIQNIPPKLVL